MKSTNAKYIDNLFTEEMEGYIQVSHIENKSIKSRYTNHKNIKDVIEDVQGNSDVYMTTNTVYKPFRLVENIRQLRALYIDLDIHQKDYSKSETVYYVLELAKLEKIPKPTYIVDSGRGIHLYWKIEHAPYQALTTWQELEDYLYYQLKHLGADKKATDGVRLLRVAGTINSKSNSECKVLKAYKRIYSMYVLREEYINYSNRYKTSKVKKKTNKTKVINNKMFNSYSLHMSRLQDITMLCELRKYKVTGYRNMIIHCYAYWKGIYVRDNDILLKDVHDFNQKFSEPLKSNEIDNVVRCIHKAVDKFIAYEQGIRSSEIKRVSKGMRDKGGYWYKNDTLITKLDITTEEQKHMKTIIATDEKYLRNNEKRRKARRNEKGLTKKQQELIELKVKVFDLRKDGLSIRKIAEKLDISKGSVENILKKNL